jgi:hypothetical protein
MAPPLSRWVCELHGGEPMTAKLKIAEQVMPPYRNDAEYLEDELKWLQTRVSRISAERSYSEALTEELEGDPAHSRRPGRLDSREWRCRTIELREKEQGLRREIVSRLQRNRTASDSPQIGLDELCLEFDLSGEERLILLCLSCISISQTLAEQTFGHFVHHWGAISVADLVEVLDPRCLADRLEFRKFFRPNSALVQHGLALVEREPEPAADSLLRATVRLSLESFGKICGDPDTINEGD